jgi:glycosyltransferase involved in cell wall biosynthesis
MEGFGLPAVEAAACGCPVIATNASPLPAILGEGGIYFNPNSQDELEAALMLVLRSESTRLYMRQAGLNAVTKLTWETAAMQLKEAIKKVFQDEPAT